jgi:hypothetical protein
VLCANAEAACFRLQLDVSPAAYYDTWREALASMFATADANVSIRRLQVSYPVQMKDSVPAHLDALLAPRSWLFERDQSFDWHEQQQVKQERRRALRAVSAMSGLGALPRGGRVCSARADGCSGEWHAPGLGDL